MGRDPDMSKWTPVSIPYYWQPDRYIAYAQHKDDGRLVGLDKRLHHTPEAAVRTARRIISKGEFSALKETS